MALRGCSLVLEFAVLRPRGDGFGRFVTAFVCACHVVEKQRVGIELVRGLEDLCGLLVLTIIEGHLPVLVEGFGLRLVDLSRVRPGAGGGRLSDHRPSREPNAREDQVEDQGHAGPKAYLHFSLPGIGATPWLLGSFLFLLVIVSISFFPTHKKKTDRNDVFERTNKSITTRAILSR